MSNKTYSTIDSDKEDVQKVFDVNVVSACVCTREAINDMRKRNVEGHVIIINR